MGDDKKRVTLSGRAPETDEPGAPASIDPATGMHGDYWVLPEEERAKGYVRPVRTKYRHVGPRASAKQRDLTAEEQERYAAFGYAKYEEYPDPEASVVGRFWTQAELDRIGGCGAVTTMAPALAETYARDPKYYGATFCAACRGHFPVAEFTWDGTDEKVGS